MRDPGFGVFLLEGSEEAVALKRYRQGSSPDTEPS